MSVVSLNHELGVVDQQKQTQVKHHELQDIKLDFNELKTNYESIVQNLTEKNIKKQYADQVNKVLSSLKYDQLKLASSQLSKINKLIKN